MSPADQLRLAESLRTLARFAEPSDPGPPGPPPRPGLTWKRETQRWVRADGTDEPGQGGRPAAGGAAAASPPPPPPPPPPPTPVLTGAARRFPKFPEPVVERIPGLTPDESALEEESQRYAHANYPRIKAAFLAEPENVARGPDGAVRSVTLNTDEFRQFLPGYTGTNAQSVHEAASWLNKALYADTLREMSGRGNGRLMVLAGGGGSGKGTATKGYITKDDYPVILDQVSDNLRKLEAKLDEAKAAGFTPEYVFVDRQPAAAWGGVEGRAVGLRTKGRLARTVRVDMAVRANVEARRTALELLRKRPDIPARIIDNRQGYDRRLITDRAEAIAHLEKQLADAGEPEALTERLAGETAARYLAGGIPEDIAAGLLGPARMERLRGGRAEPMAERALAALSRAVGLAGRLRR